MRAKQRSLIITFSTTTEAMGAEKFCIARGLPGRLIPVPREITAGCGLAWKAPPEEEARITGELHAGGLYWAAVHMIEI